MDNKNNKKTEEGYLLDTAFKWAADIYLDSDLVDLLDSINIEAKIEDFKEKVFNCEISTADNLVYIMIAHFYFEKYKNQYKDFRALSFINKALDIAIDLEDFEYASEIVENLSPNIDEKDMSDNDKVETILEFYNLKYKALTNDNKCFTKPDALIASTKGFLIALKSDNPLLLLKYFPMGEMGKAYTSFNNDQAFEAIVIKELEPILQKSHDIYSNFQRYLIIYAYIVYITTRKRDIDFQYNEMSENYFNSFEELINNIFKDEIDKDYNLARLYLARSMGASAAKDDAQSAHYAYLSNEIADNLLEKDFNVSYTLKSDIDHLSSNDLIDFEIEDLVGWLISSYSDVSATHLSYSVAVSIIKLLNYSFANGYPNHQLEEDNAPYFDLNIAPIYLSAFKTVKESNIDFMKSDYMITAAYLMVIIGDLDMDKQLFRTAFDELIKVFSIYELINLSPKFVNNINKEILDNMDSKNMFVRIMMNYKKYIK